MSSSVKGFAELLHLSLAEILEATNNFAFEIFIDSDGSSSTYTGQLLLGGELITITARKVDYGGAEFWKEIRVLSSLKHENIVSFIGYCKEKGAHIIINKHEVNGSLYVHLRRKTMITWIQKLKISVGIARGLSYIHYDEGRDFSIIHRDINSSTILLDENWVPKLSGFHLSIIIPVDERHRAHNSELYGTPGYVDPVYIKTGTVSHKSDVYSLGIVLFEILCGRLAWDDAPPFKCFDEMAKYHYENGKLDDLIGPDLRAQMDIQSFNLFSKIAYSCLNQDPSQRPNILRIVRVLEKALELQQKHENPLILKVPSAVEVEDTSYRSLEGGNLELTKIPLSDILSATEHFDEKYKIASGGFGTVYKAKLDHYDRNNLRLIDGKNKSELQKKCSTVAIKRITAREDKLGEQGFDIEIKMLFNCDHPNIISLLGFCDDGQELILVYELASNKSLEDFLENGDDILNFTLNWEQRLKICIGIACGLNYLHTERGIIHRDIKSANILLNENWDAKIADFGLSTSHPTNQQANTIQTKKLAGTPFYMDPEYEKTGILRKASDIYSFGVVLFEIMSGRLAYHQSYIKKNRKGVAAIARQRFREETILHKLVDPVLKEEYLSQDSLDTFSKIAYKCLDKSQANRPKAKDIIEELRKALSFQEPQEDKEDILRIPLDNILLATRYFSMPIRSGYFAKVYKGEIVTHDNEHNTIAVRRLNRSYYQGPDRYVAECTVLSKYKHENVIGLVGYCEEGDEMVIVYEYASNSSLDRHLRNSDLTWMKRLNICIDVARGIDFLHEGLGTSEFVIHGNIEIDNILLDGDWKAKLSDFGTSLTIPIYQQMDYTFNDLAGEIVHIDPVNLTMTALSKESDIYSLGEVLLDVLCGRFSLEHMGSEFRIMIAERYFENGTLEEIVLNCIKEQIVPRSLAMYASIAFQCLHSKREMRPTASEVIVQLTQALEFQVDHEMWEPKLPKDYQNIIQLSMSPESYSTTKKEDLYNIFSNGILLQHEKVLSFRGNGERNEMISARNFSYVHSCPHKWRSLPESRFEKVPEMLDVSNLMIEIITRPQFLTPNTVYGVHLVFKFCESSTFSASPTYVNLKYRHGSETLHAYFATRRDHDWMMIELCRFLYHIEDDISFMFLFESFSPYFSKDGAIYVEGIEFRAIDEVKHKNIEKPEQGQQLPTNYEEILNGYINQEDDEKLFWESEVNKKKQLMIPAKAVLYNFSDVKLFNSKASADSRFLEVIELLPQQIFHINCKIESQMLSQDTEYVCRLVFKISEESHGLQCPVKVRDLLHPENKEPEFIYFISPRPWNLHDITRVPEQREDGWMGVNVGRFNSAHDLKSDCILVNLNFTSYEGTMSGLILCGLEFRPV